MHSMSLLPEQVCYSRAVYDGMSGHLAAASHRISQPRIGVIKHAAVARPRPAPMRRQSSATDILAAYLSRAPQFSARELPHSLAGHQTRLDDGEYRRVSPFLDGAFFYMRRAGEPADEPGPPEYAQALLLPVYGAIPDLDVRILAGGRAVLCDHDLKRTFWAGRGTPAAAKQPRGLEQ